MIHYIQLLLLWSNARPVKHTRCTFGERGIMSETYKLSGDEFPPYRSKLEFLQDISTFQSAVFAISYYYLASCIAPYEIER